MPKFPMATPLENSLRATLKKRPVVFNLHAPVQGKADLFSNDYLSLASDPVLRSRLLDRLHSEPGDILGSTGSRLLDGNTGTHVHLEEKVRRYFYAEAALLFNSGYDANISLFGALPQKGDVFVFDKYVHASILDGFRLSRIPTALYPFEHNSVESLEEVLQNLVASTPSIREGSSTVFVALESIYSMDGDVAPLYELVEAVERILPKGCGQIYVDESHSTGLYGFGGRGLVSQLGLERRVAFRLYTFSKALASSGAVLIVSPLVRRFLVNYARPFFYSTALSRVCLLATEMSLDMVRGEIGDQLRKRLFSLVSYATDLLNKELASVPGEYLRLPTPNGSEIQTAVIPLISSHVVPLCMRLRARGWAAAPITPPTVPAGEDRIRFIVHARNTEEEIRDFVRDVIECVREGNWEKERMIGPGVPFDMESDVTLPKPIAKL